MIPDANKIEWSQLVSGAIQPTISSLSLQLKINALKLDYKLTKIDLKTAAYELQKFCQLNEKIHQKDINNIFNLTV